MLISMFLTEEYSRFPESRHSSKEGYMGIYTVYISRQKALSSAVFFSVFAIFPNDALLYPRIFFYNLKNALFLITAAGC